MVKRKVVVIGGGTGTFPVISSLKHQGVEIASIIAVSDSGGSTGKLRDEFGFQPVGDLRQALAALAELEGEEWIRKILLYRFEKGEGLKGHNLGNLLLTALQDMTGDTTEALLIAEKIFRIQGEVIPATKDNVHLQIEYADGDMAIGEHVLDGKLTEVKKIKQVKLVDKAKINDQAARAIKEANVIVIGPGDYYASLFAALLPDGTKSAFAQTKATIVYFINLMTRFTQTHEMSAADHLTGIEELIGRPVDKVVLNNEAIQDEMLALYAADREYPVVDDLNDVRVIRHPLLSPQIFEKSSNDTAHRSLLRHDPEKLQAVLAQILQDSI